MIQRSDFCRRTAAVYARACARVKWIIALVLANVAGCATANLNDPTTHAQAPVGMWYSVEQAAAAPIGLKATIDRDFANLANMGVDLVLAEHFDPRDVELLLAAATAHQLHLVFADPVAVRYVRTGWRQAGWFALPSLIPAHPAVTARYIGCIVDSVTLKRALSVADAARDRADKLALAVEAEAAMIAQIPPGKFEVLIQRRQSDEPAVGGGSVEPGVDRRLATVACVRGRRDNQADLRTWLAEYHEALAEGITDGVVFDRYRSVPGSVRGVVLSSEALAPERIAILRRIADRVHRWGDTLAGLRFHARTTLALRDVELDVVVLAGARRQCLLIINPSTKLFARGELTLDASLARGPFDRAVQVAKAEDITLGNVYPVREGQAVIPIVLAPGEAELFELF